MDDEPHVSTTVITQALQRRLADILWVFIRVNWKWVLGTIVGFVIGYCTLEWHLHDALRAADSAKQAADKLDRKIDQLATKSDVEAVNKRIDDWQFFLSHEANTPPVPGGTSK